MVDEITEPDVIRQQMEQTRESLQSKLVTLEQQVKDTVQEATGAVTDTVEAVKETVENVKDTVQGTVDTVKDTVQGTVDTMRDTVQDTVQSVKDTLDLSSHVQEHPWLMVAGATMVGFAGGRLLHRNRQQPVPALPAADMPALRNGNGTSSYVSPPPPAPPKRTWWDTISEHYGDEIGKLKGLALGTAGGVIRELLVANVAPALSDQVKEVVNNFTTKLGGQVIEGPILDRAAEPKSNGVDRTSEHERDVEKELVSARW